MARRVGVGRDSGSGGVTWSEKFGEGTGSSLKVLEDYWVELCCIVKSDDRKYSWRSRVKHSSCIRTLDEVALGSNNRYYGGAWG